jgi:hypothetical protein
MTEQKERNPVKEIISDLWDHSEWPSLCKLQPILGHTWKLNRSRLENSNVKPETVTL